jgi:endonuclease YncB( thermonuclease family)
LAKKASAFTKDAVANALEVDVKILKWDKYGGRALGTIFLDHQSLAESLISAGLARPYKGDAKQSWCE